jgi:hypothetical protein
MQQWICAGAISTEFAAALALRTLGAMSFRDASTAAN